MRCIVTTESGHTYVGETMGTGQHGNEDVGFTHDVLTAMVDNNDAADSNGGGIRHDISMFIDVVIDGPVETTYGVPMVGALYVPQGRAWEILTVHDYVSNLLDDAEDSAIRDLAGAWLDSMREGE